MGYEYDVFVSYNHSDPVGHWVNNHFVEELNAWLNAEGLLKPRIYIDKLIGTGYKWRPEIEHALKTSRCLVSIWSPEYFYSDWCLTELYTMLHREKPIKKSRLGLVYPIRYSDGIYFPKEFNKIQYRDMQHLNCPRPIFKEDKKYNLFIDEMKEVAQELLPMIKNAPQWRSNWKVVHKKAKPSINIPFPRL